MPVPTMSKHWAAGTAKGSTRLPGYGVDLHYQHPLVVEDLANVSVLNAQDEAAQLRLSLPTASRNTQAADVRERTNRLDGKRYRKQVKHEVGSKVLATASFDQQQRVAEVVSRKSEKDKGDSYYLHYVDCDKRLDEWLSADNVKPLESGVAAALPVAITPLARQGSGLPVDGPQKVTRHQKRKYEEMVPGSGIDQDHPAEKEHHERCKVKNIEVVELGRHEIDAWYYSPYPEPYDKVEKLFICEFTLKYFRKKKTLLRHLAKLQIRHPPGDEIYRSPAPPPDNQEYVGGAVASPPISVFEVDGKASKVYCQNLCLMSKLFLDHKTLYYDVDPFLFYVLCERDEEGYHVVGYFSKEKNSMEDYNLACILTLPPYQRHGYGKFLIAFSYELSKKEMKHGTPERPLSDLGQVSYRSYWRRVLLEALHQCRGAITIKELVETTAICERDVIETLTSLQLLKYWKGQHIISLNTKMVEEHLRNMQRPVLEIDRSRLHWVPHTLQPTKRKSGQ